MATATVAAPQAARSRWVSLIEFLLGSAVVIGHNVFHVVPNEVYILTIAGLVSFRLRDGSWKEIGLRLPRSWKKTVLLALGVAVLRELGSFVVEPLGMRIWHRAPDVSQFNALTGNVKRALFYFVLVWTLAAFGEELSYRGYLLTRAADVGRRSKLAYAVALVLSAVLFGYGHYYKGPTGIADSAMAGLLLGGAYILTERNLWVPILAHGFVDTFGIVVVFFGWAS